MHLYFLPVNRSGGLCNRLRGSTLVNEDCVAGTQWVGSVTGMVGSMNSVAWTVVLVSNNNIYIDIKLYFCFVHRSILKYQVTDVFGERPSELSRKF